VDRLGFFSNWAKSQLWCRVRPAMRNHHAPPNFKAQIKASFKTETVAMHMALVFFVMVTLP